MVADYSFYVKSIANCAPTFFGYIISVLAGVFRKGRVKTNFLFMIKQRALEEADVLFQQLSYPDENHGLVGLRPHFYHSLSNFILNDCFGRNEVL